MGRCGIAGIASRLRYGRSGVLIRGGGGFSNLQNTKDKAPGISMDMRLIYISVNWEILYKPAMVIVIIKLMRFYACFLSFSGKCAH